MMKLTGVSALKVFTIFCLAGIEPAWPGEWTSPAEVRHEENLALSYRAKYDGPYLVVSAALTPGWHTFAMDNKQRAEEKLAGKRALGLDRATEIVLDGGVEVVGPWYQSPPKDFSKPELRWFSWGFEEQAMFVAKVRRSGAAPPRMSIRGQACTETTCKNIDVAISLPDAGVGDGSPSVDLKNFVQVRDAR
jgi:DsbC/DsbD-like thiol-disulfide interchange protein